MTSSFYLIFEKSVSQLYVKKLLFKRFLSNGSRCPIRILILHLQILTEVLSHPVVGHKISNNLSYDHSIFFKLISFESLNTVVHNHMICFEFIVIQTFLDSKNARDVRFCQDKSLVVCRMKGTKDRQTLV